MNQIRHVLDRRLALLIRAACANTLSLALEELRALYDLLGVPAHEALVARGLLNSAIRVMKLGDGLIN